MATYSSYRKITSENITDGSIVDSHFSPGDPAVYGVKWFFGQPCACSTGCCCLWTVPTRVKRLHIEMWGAGGGGHGSCSCNRCQHFKGAGGGYYNSKTITVSPGWTYTVCASGDEVKLKILDPGTFSWWDAKTGGTQLGTLDSLYAKITQTTPFYVQKTGGAVQYDLGLKLCIFY